MYFQECDPLGFFEAFLGAPKVPNFGNFLTVMELIDVNKIGAKIGAPGGQDHLLKMLFFLSCFHDSAFRRIKSFCVDWTPLKECFFTSLSPLGAPKDPNSGKIFSMW